LSSPRPGPRSRPSCGPTAGEPMWPIPECRPGTSARSLAILGAAFQLDGLHAASATRRIAFFTPRPRWPGTTRTACPDEVRALGAPSHRRAVVDHLVHGHRQRGVVACTTMPSESRRGDVDLCLIEEPGEGRVVAVSMVMRSPACFILRSVWMVTFFKVHLRIVGTRPSASRAPVADHRRVQRRTARLGLQSSAEDSLLRFPRHSPDNPVHASARGW